MRTRVFSLLAVVSALVGVTPGAGATEGYVVIVHAGHEGNAVSRDTLGDLFLRRATHWGDGSEVHVVDQSLKSEIRALFSSDALGMSPLAVMNHWHQELRAGRTRRPPRVKESDAEVMAYVASTPGAIGYVSSGAPLAEGVKPLSVLD